jgi:hypothetical protein
VNTGDGGSGASGGWQVADRSRQIAMSRSRVA